jgi:hypothetical protein
MPETAREYLIARFRSDTTSLRERTESLRRGASIPGPDLETSRRMADACEAVAEILAAIAPGDDVQQELDALFALVPLLEERAEQQAATPAVRAVYAGAATRIREVRTAEQAARAAEHADVDVVVVDDDDDEEDEEA